MSKLKVRFEGWARVHRDLVIDIPENVGEKEAEQFALARAVDLMNDDEDCDNTKGEWAVLFVDSKSIELEQRKRVVVNPALLSDFAEIEDNIPPIVPDK